MASATTNISTPQSPQPSTSSYAPGLNDDLHVPLSPVHHTSTSSSKPTTPPPSPTIPKPYRRTKRKCIKRIILDTNNTDGSCSEEEEIEQSESNIEHNVIWKCPINGCSSKVEVRKNIKRHILDYHGFRLSNGKYRRHRVRCLLCGKVVLNASNLDTHQKLKHEKPQKKFKKIDQHSIDRINWK